MNKNSKWFGSSTQCIRPLYIEASVFVELHMKPRKPLAPFQNGIFESATEIIQPIQISQTDMKLLNLSVVDGNTSDKSTQEVCAIVDIKMDAYNDARLS